MYPKPQPWSGDIYTVQSGDDIASIATHYFTSVGKLKILSGLTSYNLYHGQKLQLP